MLIHKKIVLSFTITLFSIMLQAEITPYINIINNSNDEMLCNINPKKGGLFYFVKESIKPNENLCIKKTYFPENFKFTYKFYKVDDFAIYNGKYFQVTIPSNYKKEKFGPIALSEPDALDILKNNKFDIVLSKKFDDEIKITIIPKDKTIPEPNINDIAKKSMRFLSDSLSKAKVFVIGKYDNNKCKILSILTAKSEFYSCNVSNNFQIKLESTINSNNEMVDYTMTYVSENYTDNTASADIQVFSKRIANNNIDKSQIILFEKIGYNQYLFLAYLDLSNEVKYKNENWEIIEKQLNIDAQKRIQ